MRGQPFECGHYWDWAQSYSRRGRRGRRRGGALLAVL